MRYYRGEGEYREGFQRSTGKQLRRDELEKKSRTRMCRCNEECRGEAGKETWEEKRGRGVLRDKQ